MFLMAKFMKLVVVLLVFVVLCFFTSGYDAHQLDLYEGDICLKGDGDRSTDSVCKRLEHCVVAKQQIKQHIIPKLCSFIKSQPVVCCPPQNNEIRPPEKPPANQPEIKSYSAVEKCHQYSELIYSYIKNPTLVSQSNNKYIKVKNCYDVQTLIVGGTKAEPKEFPHMALVGFGNTIEEVRWACGGSLISNIWILSAAHCEKGNKLFARWVRLGDLNIDTDTDNARPSNYEIVKRVIHPNYQPPSLYNDIALFRLNKNVEFSSYVRPLCLNIDRSLTPTRAVATGWGQIQSGGPTSSDLLKVVLNNIPSSQCNVSYSSSVGHQLAFGILEESQICAGHVDGGIDTCGGDSGGPIQIKNTKYPCMYTQVGITSFGKICGDKDAPGVYTKVAKYISWIEKIVWPKDINATAKH
ncbi:venom protease-like [Adelges cooleyi]|uniref:venom protease-like n=1 Tax=Adelges cooleyi TaxID=133065 RepID=UPI0021802DF1|nr:venom protease-like [Adelges cooleyi]